VDLMGDGPDRLIDVQWCTPHLARLGAVEVDRETYLGVLPDLVLADGPDWPA
ncbi:MAG: leucyl/phenylalanyl-tRNA--protein transferase, partial [Actinomycetota bacterium]|nr:leucyl/phenylalanyl-tRNA--protein transferase [Actinomycetota bacterium]